MNQFIIHSNFTPTQMDGNFGSVYIVSLKNKQKLNQSVQLAME